MTKEEELKFKKKIKEETISREDELIDAAKRNAAIVSEFLIGAKWADKNPRKGLWDAQKVIEWLKNNASQYMEDNHKYGEGCEYDTTELIEDLTKVMN